MWIHDWGPPPQPALWRFQSTADLTAQSSARPHTLAPQGPREKQVAGSKSKKGIWEETLIQWFRVDWCSWWKRGIYGLKNACWYLLNSSGLFMLEDVLRVVEVQPMLHVPNCEPLGAASFSVRSFCFFILFAGFSRQEYWSGLPFPSPVDHILSELSTMTCPSWMVLQGMAHSFTELDKAVVHIIRLVNFLWLWFSICLPSDGEGIRDLWKLPDGRDWLRGKLGLVLMGGTLLSKSLIQFSVDGWSCVPSLLFTWGQTMVEVMKTMVPYIWARLVMEARSDAAKSNIAEEPGMLGPWIKANWKWSHRRWKEWHFRNQWTKMDWNGWI